MNKKVLTFAAIVLLLGCRSERQGTVYLDPNAPAAPVEAQTQAEAAAPAPTEATVAQALYFEAKGVTLRPGMEAAPVLTALGEPLGAFEADSCAYVGKDRFFHYPGFELTVNEISGVERITLITLVDDTVTTPEGLCIGGREQTVEALLGGQAREGYYTFDDGEVTLVVHVKEGQEPGAFISAIEYRLSEAPKA